MNNQKEPIINNHRERTNSQLRQTLNYSHKEAAASSVMTATSDNFLNAFAIFLQASATQLSMLTAIPQFIAAILQFFSVYLTSRISRKKLIVFSAAGQSLIVVCLAILATFFWQANIAVNSLIALSVLYHAATYIIQPHWRAWMGGLVPSARRGIFFANRTKITMAVSLFVFILGGLLLTLTDELKWTGLGFGLLFSAAAIGRAMSALLFYKMHDPDPHLNNNESMLIQNTFTQYFYALADKNFRNYSFFVAGMQGMVAISAPFFAVHMLNNLHFSYIEFCLTSVASIVTQFLTLNFWGKLSDSLGNHFVMMVTSCILPTLPLWWLISGNFYYIIFVQIASGIAWSGFTLSTANYLYDIRPHRSNFALYAALQTAMGALMVFFGALLGGWVMTHVDWIESQLPFTVSYTVFFVFICSSSLRSLVALWFLPRLEEPRVRNRPKVLQLIFRVARFNTISGLVIDWLTVTKRER
jgi:MFS family permease